ncbi:LytTR family DNA-binding domain-containing protein [Alloscardovia theropitheci]|nr:LytTR family DNA-binding domain-containing protein [Alloscardovia theropitheci]
MKASFQQANEPIEPFALIIAQERTAIVDSAIHLLENLQDESTSNNANLDMISGVYGKQNSLIPVSSISFFYAADKKVFARYGKRDWQINLTLKMLAAQLSSSHFVRVSNSAIINMHALVRFDLNLAGNYLAILQDGSTVKVSARYISTIKSRLISHT